MPRITLEPRFQVEYLSILDSDGNLDTALEPKLADTDLRSLYRAMLLARRLDERMVRLQRQGRIGTFAPTKGQEAAQMGSVFTLRPTDWMVPSFRETAAMIWRGWPIEKLLLFFAGHLEGGQPAPEQRDLPITIPVATQLPHAVGLAYAAQYRGDDVVVMAYFGDGATSEGDFHEALNFAGVWHVPVVFVCQNNQWAISVPLKKQTHSRTIAQKALAYGLPGIQVDGNDVLAVYAAAREAVERARAGDGPTLIECVTYRLGVHTTADDPTKYRSEAEVAMWEQKDPMTRFRAYLEKRNLLEEGLEQRVDDEIAEAMRRFEATPPADPLTMFDHVYAELPPDLEAQRDALAASDPATPPASEAEPTTQPGATPMRGQRLRGADAMAKLNMVKALNQALFQEMERDDDVLVLGEDVGVDGGVFRVTDDLQRKFGSQRVIDSPLAEAAIIGTAVGMALYGLKPVCEIQFSGFAFQCFHQIENHCARYRMRSQGRFHIPMVIRMPYGGGVRALEHHSESEEQFYAHIPGLKMVIPSGPRNARALLAAAIRDPDPVIFFEAKSLYHAAKEEVPDESEVMTIGRAQVAREGDALTLIAYGAMLRVALEAADVLATRTALPSR